MIEKGRYPNRCSIFLFLIHDNRMFEERAFYCWRLKRRQSGTGPPSTNAKQKNRSRKNGYKNAKRPKARNSRLCSAFLRLNHKNQIPRKHKITGRHTNRNPIGCIVSTKNTAVTDNIISTVIRVRRCRSSFFS